jgi:uncharacterized protein
LTAVDPKLLDSLICPLSKMPLAYDKEKLELVCKANGLAYPIRDAVPVMLAGEARDTGAAE